MKVLVQRVVNPAGVSGLNTIFYDHANGPWPADPAAALEWPTLDPVPWFDVDVVQGTVVSTTLEVVFPNDVLDSWVFTFVQMAIDALERFGGGPPFIWPHPPGALRFHTVQVPWFPELKHALRRVLVP